MHACAAIYIYRERQTDRQTDRRIYIKEDVSLKDTFQKEKKR